jgi:hypothetical protein
VRLHPAPARGRAAVRRSARAQRSLSDAEPSSQKRRLHAVRSSGAHLDSRPWRSQFRPCSRVVLPGRWGAPPRVPPATGQTFGQYNLFAGNSVHQEEGRMARRGVDWDAAPPASATDKLFLVLNLLPVHVEPGVPWSLPNALVRLSSPLRLALSRCCARCCGRSGYRWGSSSGRRAHISPGVRATPGMPLCWILTRARRTRRGLSGRSSAAGRTGSLTRAGGRL